MEESMLQLFVVLINCLMLTVLAVENVTVLPSSEVLLSRVRRVVGGQATDSAQVPYLVNIRRNGFFECGGSLVTPKCVLTAAHCIRDSNPTNFLIRGGVTYLNDFSNTRKVKRIIRPIKFDSKSLEHDIAVFELESPLEGAHIAPIALSERTLQTEELISISGWGLTSENARSPPNQMHSVQLRIVSQSTCQKLYEGYRNVSDAMFCAAVPGYKDACSADSGGPAVFDGKLVGVVSWGRSYECGRAHSPGVYVRITEVRAWINAILNKYCL